MLSLAFCCALELFPEHQSLSLETPPPHNPGVRVGLPTTPSRQGICRARGVWLWRQSALGPRNGRNTHRSLVPNLFVVVDAWKVKIFSPTPPQKSLCIFLYGFSINSEHARNSWRCCPWCMILRLTTPAPRTLQPRSLWGLPSPCHHFDTANFSVIH